MPFDPGTKLGRYQIRELLGAGGMGEVYRARDARLDREVAVKVLPAAVAESSSALERFQREARAVAALAHPNILAIHDFGVDDGRAWAAMEGPTKSGFRTSACHRSADEIRFRIRHLSSFGRRNRGSGSLLVTVRATKSGPDSGQSPESASTSTSATAIRCSVVRK